MIAKNTLSENYDCAEYLSKYQDGYFDINSCLQLVLPVSLALINSDHNHLVIGYAGVDGIEFCYRIQQAGIWAYYPVEMKFQKVSANISELVEGWHSGTIKV